MSEPQTIYEPDMWPHIAVSGRREDLCEWLRANGIDPDGVTIGAPITVESTNPEGGQLIRYTAYLLTEDGHKYVDEATGDGAQEERTVLLAVEPPMHWYLSKENTDGC